MHLLKKSLENWVTAQRTPSFLSREELVSEFENFLFAGGISEKEYLQEMVHRSGMRQRLSRQQRQRVWDIRRRFLASSDQGEEGEAGSGEQSRLYPFREGPLPELYTAIGTEDLRKLLLEKIRLFIEEPGYDPENLCILVPRNREIAVLRKVLAKAGLEVEDISEDQFSFSSAGRIRAPV